MPGNMGYSTAWRTNKLYLNIIPHSHSLLRSFVQPMELRCSGNSPGDLDGTLGLTDRSDHTARSLQKTAPAASEQKIQKAACFAHQIE